MNRWEPDNVLRALDTGLIDSVQVVYNIFDQDPEDQLFPYCLDRGIAVIARVPFDEGSLTGTLSKDSTWPEGDWRNIYFGPENLGASVDHAEALRPEVPEGMTMPEMALRFDGSRLGRRQRGLQFRPLRIGQFAVRGSAVYVIEVDPPDGEVPVEFAHRMVQRYARIGEGHVVAALRDQWQLQSQRLEKAHATSAAHRVPLQSRLRWRCSPLRCGP